MNVFILRERTDTYKLNSPESVVDHMKVEARIDREVFFVLLMDTKLTVIRTIPVSVGVLVSAYAGPREIFKTAIVESAAGIILVHNHPSGVPEPSEQDILLTKRLVSAGKLLDIPVRDHIILGSNGKYYSFMEGGRL